VVRLVVGEADFGGLTFGEAAIGAEIGHGVAGSQPLGRMGGKRQKTVRARSEMAPRPCRLKLQTMIKR
jgi:hypothetical protein